MSLIDIEKEIKTINNNLPQIYKDIKKSKDFNKKEKYTFLTLIEHFNEWGDMILNYLKDIKNNKKINYYHFVMELDFFVINIFDWLLDYLTTYYSLNNQQLKPCFNISNTKALLSIICEKLPFILDLKENEFKDYNNTLFELIYKNI